MAEIEEERDDAEMRVDIPPEISAPLGQYVKEVFGSELGERRDHLVSALAITLPHFLNELLRVRDPVQAEAQQAQPKDESPPPSGPIETAAQAISRLAGEASRRFVSTDQARDFLATQVAGSFSRPPISDLPLSDQVELVGKIVNSVARSTQMRERAVLFCRLLRTVLWEETNGDIHRPHPDYWQAWKLTMRFIPSPQAKRLGVIGGFQLLGFIADGAEAPSVSMEELKDLAELLGRSHDTGHVVLRCQLLTCAMSLAATFPPGRSIPSDMPSRMDALDLHLARQTEDSIKIISVLPDWRGLITLGVDSDPVNEAILDGVLCCLTLAGLNERSKPQAEQWIDTLIHLHKAITKGMNRNLARDSDLLGILVWVGAVMWAHARPGVRFLARFFDWARTSLGPSQDVELKTFIAQVMRPAEKGVIEPGAFALAFDVIRMICSRHDIGTPPLEPGDPGLVGHLLKLVRQVFGRAIGEERVQNTIADIRKLVADAQDLSALPRQDIVRHTLFPKSPQISPPVFFGLMTQEEWDRDLRWSYADLDNPTVAGALREAFGISPKTKSKRQPPPAA